MTKQLCILRDCLGLRWRDGFCKKHGRNFRVSGHPLGERIVLTTEERFRSKVHKSSTDKCWEWLAAKNSRGYGVFSMRRRIVFAHRYAYEAARGPIPYGL